MNVYEVQAVSRATGENYAVTTRAMNQKEAEKRVGNLYMIVDGSARAVHVGTTPEQSFVVGMANWLAAISALLFFLLPLSLLVTVYVGVTTRGERGSGAFIVNVAAILVWGLLYLASLEGY